MSVEIQARRKAREISLRYGITVPSLENVLYILEDQGYELLEYSTDDTASAIYQMIERLDLLPYACSGKAFAYRRNNAKLVFICEDTNAAEKLYALAHELGHIVCNHLDSGITENAIEQEFQANEFAHFLLHPPVIVRCINWIKSHKKVVAVSAVGALLVAAGIVLAVNMTQGKVYHKEYYVTQDGERYHEEDCIFVKNNATARRLTEKSYRSGEYTPCQICLPD